MRIAIAVVLLACSGAAAADLYRWVDPETGSVKFSSYPPPWYGDAQQERRAPKVQVIPAGQPAGAAEPAAPENPALEAQPAGEAGGKPAPPAASALEARRKTLSRQLSDGIAALLAAPPGEGARPFADLGQKASEYRSVESSLQAADPAGQAARRAEWNGLAAGLQSRRRVLLQQIAAKRSPSAGAAPQELQGEWRALGQQLEALGWVDNALKLFDPRGDSTREAQQRSLTEQLVQEWKPALEAGQGRAQ
jgi:hypothetical protein